MSQEFPVSARITAAVIAIAAFATLALQTSVNEGPAPAAFASLFRFFTIWSNFAAGLVMGWVAMKRQASGRVLFALATALTIVALVYHALLSADHHPIGLDWWTNLMFHTAIPAGFIAWWIAFSDRDHLTWRSLPLVMPFPIVYTAFALVYGAKSGFYAYFFLDLPSLGWGQLILNIVGLGLFFMAMGAVLLGLRKLMPSARA